ncbi:hypothetical protein MBLNU230_g0838t1 [Neophaeotheca triangularis]
MPSHFYLTTFLNLLVATTPFAQAQSASGTIVYPTSAAPSATTIPSGSGFEYVGCYNETVGFEEAGGVRAVQEGNFSAMNDLTIEACLEHCSEAGSYQYVGIEYGRECYCGAYLSTLSEEIDDSNCNFACNGNRSQVCGGQLAITLYNSTRSVQQGTAWSLMGHSGSAAWYGTAAVLTLIVAAAL